MAYFWAGISLDNFLFEGLNVTTPAGFAGLFVSVVSASILCEGVRTLRDFLFRRFFEARQLSSALNRSPGAVRYRPNGPIDESETEALHRGDGDAPAAFRPIGDGDNPEDDHEEAKFVSPTTPYRCPSLPLETHRSGASQWLDLSLSTLLHMIYVGLGYTLMLAVMTWNVWILVAVGIGIGLGFLIFGAMRHNRDIIIRRKSRCETLGQAVEPCQPDPKLGNGSSEGSTASTAGGSNGKAEDCGCGDGASSAPLLHPRLTVGAEVHIIN